MDRAYLLDHFPIFAHKRAKGPYVYLDNASTTHKPRQVIDAVSRFYIEENANVHRGVDDASEQVTARYEQVRAKVAAFIGAAPSEVAFTSGTTDSINAVAQIVNRLILKSGDEIVVSQVEHHSNLLPWQRLARQTGAQPTYIPLDTSSMTLDISRGISSKTKVVALSLYSNVLGPIWKDHQALVTCIEKAHAHGALVLIDAAQVAPRCRLDVASLGADFVAFSSHKMCGPTGVGVLYVAERLHDTIEPYRVGGSMVYSAGYEHSVWEAMPMRLEAGTPPIAQVIGLGAAIDFLLEHVDIGALHAHERALCSRFLDGLARIGGVHILGNEGHLAREGHIVTFVLEGVHAHDVVACAAQHGVVLRGGHHCAQPLHELLGHPASVRMSVYLYNTADDIDYALEVIALAKKELGQG